MMITSEDIVTIAQNVLSTMLELEAVPSEVACVCDGTDQVSGCVQISGQWQGAVVVQSSEYLAKIFACRLFDTSIDAVTDEDLRDAFAEMTNMIGGNIKGQVPCPSFLSIPSVTTGRDFDFHLSGVSSIRDVTLVCDEELLRIMICEEDLAHARNLPIRKLDSVGSR
jgi:chemotaxis protein CheX